MTTKEKIEVIRAYDNGYTIEYASLNNVIDEFWGDLLAPEFDFSRFKYRVKSNEKIKTTFRLGDVVVYKNDAGYPTPDRFEITKILKDGYELDDTIIRSIEYCKKEFINERDVLWYFEVYDSHQGRWSIFDAGRLTIDEMTKEYAPYDDHIHKFRPFYTLGFSMRELNDNG
jgi:hypothetical protein